VRIDHDTSSRKGEKEEGGERGGGKGRKVFEIMAPVGPAEEEKEKGRELREACILPRSIESPTEEKREEGGERERKGSPLLLRQSRMKKERGGEKKKNIFDPR